MTIQYNQYLRKKDPDKSGSSWHSSIVSNSDGHVIGWTKEDPEILLGWAKPFHRRVGEPLTS